MIWALRNGALAAGVAALISSQAAYAAPSLTPLVVDPFVALSVFGTAESRAAVCAAGASAVAAGAAVAVAQGVPGCLFPVTEPPAVTEATPPPLLPHAPGPGIGTLPLLLGLVAVLGLAALALSGGGGDGGGQQPVSPG